MSNLSEVERLVFDLPEAQRALLAAQLLGSLSPMLHDNDHGIQDALNRDREFDSAPSFGLSLDQLDQQIQGRRRME
jgi:nucleotidyltransferase/DNA polymerase involved in DNA repair